MANHEKRLANLEKTVAQKRMQRQQPRMNNVFILPDDEKLYQAFVRYAKKHPREREWVAIILPAKKEIK